MSSTLVAMVTFDITPGCQVIVEVEKDYILCGARTETKETGVIETVRPKPPAKQQEFNKP
jgi:hypothetical protein